MLDHYEEEAGMKASATLKKQERRPSQLGFSQNALVALCLLHTVFVQGHTNGGVHADFF